MTVARKGHLIYYNIYYPELIIIVSYNTHTHIYYWSFLLVNIVTPAAWIAVCDIKTASLGKIRQYLDRWPGWKGGILGKNFLEKDYLEIKERGVQVHVDQAEVWD